MTSFDKLRMTTVGFRMTTVGLRMTTVGLRMTTVGLGSRWLDGLWVTYYK
jgi:hypothetical protein